VNLPRIFRRTRPQPLRRLDPHEARIISAHGLTEAQWQALTPQQRADRRANYTKASRYVS